MNRRSRKATTTSTREPQRVPDALDDRRDVGLGARRRASHRAAVVRPQTIERRVVELFPRLRPAQRFRRRGRRAARRAPWPRCRRGRPPRSRGRAARPTRARRGPPSSRRARGSGPRRAPLPTSAPRRRATRRRRSPAPRRRRFPAEGREVPSTPFFVGPRDGGLARVAHEALVRGQHAGRRMDLFQSSAVAALAPPRRDEGEAVVELRRDFPRGEVAMEGALRCPRAQFPRLARRRNASPGPGRRRPGRPLARACPVRRRTRLRPARSAATRRLDPRTAT